MTITSMTETATPATVTITESNAKQQRKTMMNYEYITDNKHVDDNDYNEEKYDKINYK